MASSLTRLVSPWPPSLSFSRLHFILQSLSTKPGLLLAVILLHWLPSQKVEAARPGNGYSQNCLRIRPPYAIGQSHDMVCPDSRVWGERFYLLKLNGTENITADIFEKYNLPQPTTLKKKLIPLLGLENSI